MLQLTLLPLFAQQAAPLQAVYAAAPAYWRLFGLQSLPPEQATRDLVDAEGEVGRSLLGILQRADLEDPAAAPIMVGAIDLRRHFPDESDVTIGLFIVAEPYQRLGIGRAAWALLEVWLAQQPGLATARLNVEQFNLPALRFFTALGFVLTGEATRHKINDHFVRYLAMQKSLSAESLSQDASP